MPALEFSTHGSNSTRPARLGAADCLTRITYDALADRYAEMFPGPYQSLIEQHAVAASVEEIHSPGVVVDAGCGLGHVTADLSRRGLMSRTASPRSGKSAPHWPNHTRNEPMLVKAS